MAKLTRNYSDPESRRWWEEAEKAAKNAPRIVVPAASAPVKVEVKAKGNPDLKDPEGKDKQ